MEVQLSWDIQERRGSHHYSRRDVLLGGLSFGVRG
jgi:hypothetical protein